MGIAVGILFLGVLELEITLGHVINTMVNFGCSSNRFIELM